MPASIRTVLERQKTLAQIYAAGMWVREHGGPVTANLYPKGSEEHQVWYEGWHERDALDEADAVDDFSPP